MESDIALWRQYVGGRVLKIGVGAVLAVAVAGGAMVVTRQKAAQKAPQAAKPSAAGIVSTVAQGGNRGLLGAPDFMPSPDRPVGNRGDWTGRYPGATPPIEWYRRIKGAPKFACQARKPGNEVPKLKDGYYVGLQDWLVLGYKEYKKVDDAFADEIVPGNASPDEGEKAGDLVWKKAPDRHNLVCGGLIYGPVEGADKLQQWEPLKNGLRVLYAHTYVYSDQDCKARLRISFSQVARVWINGEGQLGPKTEGQTHNLKPVDLKKGWNSIMVKVGGATSKWGFHAFLQVPFPRNPAYETKNIVWTVPMPQRSNAQPIIVGDKLFIMCEPDLLICMDKKDGKVLWTRANPALLGMAEKKKDDASFQKDARAALSAYQDNCARMIEEYTKSDAQKNVDPKKSLGTGKLKELGAAADPALQKKLNGSGEQEQPGWACCAPCSDGKNVYAWFENGNAVCYDLNGNLQWVCYVDFRGYTHHGYSSSPVLVDGKFIIEQGAMKAIDAKTGKLVWEGHGGGAWGSSIPVHTSRGTLIMNPAGKLIKASDGAAIWKDDIFGNTCSSAMTDGDMIYSSGGRVVAVPSGTDPAKPSVRTYPASNLSDGGGQMSDSIIGSGLLYDGILYSVGVNGTFVAADAGAGKELYRRYLDVYTRLDHYISPGVCADITLGGKYLYVMDDTGHTVVLKPGREFQEVARNDIYNIHEDSNEGLWRPPFHDGSRIYLRTASMVCCIGEK